MQISKRKIPEEFKDTMFSVLFSVLGKRSSLNDFRQMVLSMFSPAEQTMLLKRVTIWFLLEKGVSFDTIAKALRISIGSISRYATLSIPDPNQLIANLLDLFNIFSPSMKQLNLATSL